MRTRWHVLVLVAATLVLCLRQSPLTQPITSDNQIYFYIAERVAAGTPPHVSLVDHKHQLAALLSGWAMRAGRTVGLDHVSSTRVLSIAVASAAVAALWLLAMRLTSSAAGGWVAALVMLGSTDFLFQASMGVRPKIFMALFLILALLLFERRRPAAAGAAAAGAFLCWQPSLLVLFAMAAACALRGPRGRGLGLGPLLAGFALPVVFYELYFLWHGVLGEQLRQSYLLRADLGGLDVPPLGDTLFFVLGHGRERLKLYNLAGLVFLLSFVAAWLAAVRRPRGVLAWLREHPAHTAAIAAAHGAVAFTAIDHQGYPDAFFFLPFVSLACAWVAVRIATRMARHTRPARRIRLREAVVGLLLLPLAIHAVGGRVWFRTKGITLADQRELAAFTGRLSRKYGQVWAIGCPHLLALEGMANASPFGLLTDEKVRAYLRPQLSEDGMPPFPGNQPPGIVLLARGGSRDIHRWLGRNYTSLENERYEKHGIKLWMLKQRGGARRPAPS